MIKGYLREMKYLLISILFICACAEVGKISKEEEQASLYFSYGTSQLVEKQYTRALGSLIKANRLSPNDSKILNNLGMAYYFKGKEKKALKILKSAIRIEKNNSDARNNLASIHLKNGNINEAEKQYLIILEDLLYKKIYRVYYNLGIIEYKRRKFKKALDFFERAAGLVVDYCAASYQIAKVYEKLKKEKDAIRAYRHATQGKCAENFLPHYSLGELYLKMGKVQLGLDKYKYIRENFKGHKMERMVVKKIAFFTEKVKETKKNRRNQIETFNTGSF